jgi:uncharacterized protein (DUF1330 family)
MNGVTVCAWRCSPPRPKTCRRAPLIRPNPIAIEGPTPKFRVVINQWDSVEQVREWNKSADYQKAREVGNKYAKFQIFVVEGLPQ